MKSSAVLAALTAHLALLSSVSFGGFPTVLPDVRDFVVAANGWMTDQEFADAFAMAQAIPGPNMILMMGLVGWRVLGLPGAIASAAATCVPACAIYYGGFLVWHRFRAARWQRAVRLGLAPVTSGLIIAGGIVMARAADSGWAAALLTLGAVAATLTIRLNPLWLLVAGAAIGGLGVL